MTAAELDGHRVILSGSDDETVRVLDLATGSAVGDPFTGHDGPVNAVAAAELDGRPVVISGGRDGTVRVWDLATGSAVGGPFTGHRGPVNAVTALELDGRPVVISGSSDETVRVWDLATGAPVGSPLTGHSGPVNAVVSRTGQGLIADGCPAYVGVGARNVATVSAIRLEADGNLRWEQIAALEVRSDILALALMSRRTITVATELGIVVFDLPRTTL